jgi:Lon protease-like protein
MTTLATLPLFPLQTVLFPGGRLALKVFEARYMPHTVGTEARIVSVDADTPGVMDIVVSGERRFRLHDHSVGKGQLLSGEVEWLPPIAHQPVPDAQGNLIPLLERIVADMGSRIATPHRFEDAEWVGARYAEVLPIQALARQKLLELDDVVSRLEIIQQYLDQRGLLGAQPE